MSTNNQHSVYKKKTKPNSTGLGRALINRSAVDKVVKYQSELHKSDFDSTQSVTQQRDLDQFLSTAELAGTDFTAEKQNLKIISTAPVPSSSSSSGNPSSSSAVINNTLTLTPEEHSRLRSLHEKNKDKLRVPTRPPWDASTTPEQLEAQERASFLNWRRDLALFQESSGLLLTPFERNIQVWRQLWRVLERSQLIVQIVDARNPAVFWCRDLENYINQLSKQSGQPKRMLVLVNKADLLTIDQRQHWEIFFTSLGVRFAFFSALDATQLLEQQKLAREQRQQEEEDRDMNGGHQSSEGEEEHSEDEHDVTGQPHEADHSMHQDDELEQAEDVLQESSDPLSKTRVLNIVELEQLFLDEAPDISGLVTSELPHPKLTIGLIGYPNVGKSSTLNALLGSHLVSVSSTPGKTKHFQTHHLSDQIILCDCPGLAFPQFAATRAELVCDGVLGVDELKEWNSAIELVAKRVPKPIIEGTYGIKINVKTQEEGGNGVPTAEEVLVAYAVSRGFMRAASAGGNPDESRAARLILKDYVSAKLLYAHPPPGIDPDEFNTNSRKQIEQGLASRIQRIHSVASLSTKKSTPLPSRALALDSKFFSSSPALSHTPFVKGTYAENKVGPNGFTRVQHHVYQTAVAPDGSALSARQARMLAIANGLTPDDMSKKHGKGNKKRNKQRSGKGYD